MTLTGDQVTQLVEACRNDRDRFIVEALYATGLRVAELCGLRLSDLHFVPSSTHLGCKAAGAHLHVVRREDNPNGAWAKSRRQRVVPLDFLTVQGFDTYELERMRVPLAADSDFVFVNLFRAPIGVPLRPDGVGELLAAASRRAGLATPVRPHQLRHACGSNLEVSGVASAASFGRLCDCRLPGIRGHGPSGERDVEVVRHAV
jgi:integrase/recombinase XerD